MTDVFNQILLRIILEQELIIGPVAWDEAQKVVGLKVDRQKEEISFSDENTKKETIDKLVAQYEFLFGRASGEVCRGAVQDLISEIPSQEVPSSLK
jgi:hypothetical protein